MCWACAYSHANSALRARGTAQAVGSQNALVCDGLGVLREITRPGMQRATPLLRRQGPRSPKVIGSYVSQCHAKTIDEIDEACMGRITVRSCSQRIFGDPGAQRHSGNARKNNCVGALTRTGQPLTIISAQANGLDFVKFFA